MLSIKLFHGRDSPHEVLSNWGFDGPMLGPFTYVSMIYGTINVTDDKERVFDLVIVDGLIVYDGKFYGDMTVMNAEEPMTRIDERLLQVPQALLSKREERTPVRLPKRRFAAYRRLIEVFVDAIREHVDDDAATSVMTAVSNVVARR